MWSETKLYILYLDWKCSHVFTTKKEIWYSCIDVSNVSVLLCASLNVHITIWWIEYRCGSFIGLFLKEVIFTWSSSHLYVQLLHFKWYSSNLAMLVYIIPYQDFLIVENFVYKVNVYYEFYVTNILDYYIDSCELQNFPS
jgi:hypothetical protein